MTTTHTLIDSTTLAVLVNNATANRHNLFDDRDRELLAQLEGALATAEDLLKNPRQASGQKYPDSDAAVQIAEEAFRAGFRAAQDLVPMSDEISGPAEEHTAWCDFEPSEDCKDLVR